MDLSRKHNQRSRAAEIFRAMAQCYKQLALVLLNTFVLLIGITIASFAYYRIREGTPPPTPVYSTLLRPQAMHRMSAEQAATFFKTFDRMGDAETYIYQPWVEFSERAFNSELVNVDDTMPMPTRRTWSSDGDGQPLVVWMFGGSTMFGWGVPDDETIPSHAAKMLSRKLPQRNVTVINHGHSYFFSSQELALFHTLLRRGARPHFAVFLDGLNESFRFSLADVPAFSDRLRSAFEREQRRNPTLERYFHVSPEFPLMRLLASFRRRLSTDRIAPATSPLTYDAVHKYRVNMDAAVALGTAYGIETLFFWQPVPADANYAHARTLASRVRPSIDSDNFHFVADLFGGTDPADIYVDPHHYGDKASEALATVIAQQILAQVADR
jgi:hypothetical protein